MRLEAPVTSATCAWSGAVITSGKVAQDRPTCSGQAEMAVPLRRPYLPRLEFVTQRELHHARLGQQTGVRAEAGWRLRQRSKQRCPHALRVEAREVRYVEHLPAKLQAVGFPI